MVFAQVRPGGGKMMHGEMEREAIALDLDVPVDDAKGYFKEYMKERYGARVKGLGLLQNRTVLSVEEADIPALHAKRLDLYIQFEAGMDAGTFVLLVGRNGYDLYFSKAYEPETYSRLVVLMRAYKTFALEQRYKALLARQQKELEDLMRTQKKRSRMVDDHKDEQVRNRKRNKELDEEIKELEAQKIEADLMMERLRENIARSKEELPADQ